MALEFDFRTSGGPDAVRLFNEIGKAAEAAAAKAERANRRAEIGLRAVDATMRSVEKSAQSYVRSLGPVGAAIGALPVQATLAAGGITAIAGAMFYGTKRAIDYASALKDSAERIGFNVEALQEYRIVAGYSGVATDALQTGLERLTKNLGELHVGQGTLFTALEKTNPELLRQLQAVHSATEAMPILVRALSGITDETER